MNQPGRIPTRTILIISGAVLGVLGILMAIIIIAVLSKGRKMPDLTARLSEISGTVQIKPDNADRYDPVGNDYVLTTAMQMQTLQESRVRLDLSTGSIVRIGPLTIFSLDSRANSSNGVLSRLALQAGQLWVVLNGGSLDVVTSGGTASVRGSYMFVSVSPDSAVLEIDCLEGSCQLRNNAGSLDLTTGQKVISSDPNSLPQIQSMDQQDARLWLDNVPESAAVVPQVAGQMPTSTPQPAAGYQVDYPYWGLPGESLVQITGTICGGFARSFQLHGENLQLSLTGEFDFTPTGQGLGTWTFTGIAEDFPLTSSGSYQVQGVPGGAPPSPDAIGTYALQASRPGTPALLMDAGRWQMTVGADAPAFPLPLLDAAQTPGLWAMPLDPVGAGGCR
jgi:hypothetical protein